LLILLNRLVLFGKLYLIHCIGISHDDFQPQNVVRKGWCNLRIIDFGFSDINHTCPGWTKCYELRNAWNDVLWPDSDTLAPLPSSRILRKIKLLVTIVGGFLLLYFLA
jgi:serine/threonine protein kinase